MSRSCLNLRHIHLQQRFRAACSYQQLKWAAKCAQSPRFGTAHHHQGLFYGKYAALRQNVQQRVLCRESFGKGTQVLNGPVLNISPPGRELEAIRCLLSQCLPLAFFDVQLAGRI